MSLEEELSDAADFVQEDDTFDVDEGTSEDEVERKIAEEHVKYKEAQAKRQEEVRANRSWSAPPMESPRPEQQKERERERQARASQHDAPDPAPRAEYEPPPRPYLPAQASGGAGNLSYLSRPQSAEPRAPSRLSSSGNRGGLGSSHPPASLSGIEEEAGEPGSGGTDEGAEAEASAAPPVEEEESREPMPEPSGGRDEGEESGTRGGEPAEAEPSGPEEPEAEEVAGVPVSVYVADTLKRIIEANRWLAALGVAGKRYRLKDRYSNMTVQLIEEMAPMQYDAHAQHTYGEEAAHGHHGHGHSPPGAAMYGGGGASGGGAAAAQRPQGVVEHEDDEGGLVVEADERGDVSRAVRQQLGGAAEYCQARRAEISRLRNMPFA
eukprot:XP_001700292.1 predicted protein [Chlamydomonas reinhardtii]